MNFFLFEWAGQEADCEAEEEATCDENKALAELAVGGAGGDGAGAGAGEDARWQLLSFVERNHLAGNSPDRGKDREDAESAVEDSRDEAKTKVRS